MAIRFDDERRREFVTPPLSSPAVLRAGGEVLDSDEARAELIERSLRGEHIELELDLVAFSQTPGVMNRNFVRFRQGRLQAIAKTGKSTAFLRNHSQREVLAAGGTIVASKMVKSGAAREFHQTAHLTVPWAVQAALQGVLGRYSIGWIPLGDAPNREPVVQCSLCKAPIRDCLWRLGHYRGSEHDGRIVEFVVMNAELIETSAVNVPAVREVRARGVRQLAQLEIDRLFVVGADLVGPGETSMKDGWKKLIAALGLSADANEDSAVAAVEAQAEELAEARARAARLDKINRELELTRSQLGDVTAELDTLRAKHARLEERTRTERADAFVSRAVASGKCAANSKTAAWFRELFRGDEEAAEESLAAAPVITPVGAPMQSGQPAAGAEKTDRAPGVPDYARLATELSAEDRRVAERAGVTAEQFVRANYDDLAGDYGWASR